MDLGIIKKFVKEVLNDPAFSGVTVIINKQANASPAKPYAAVNIVSETPLGFPVSETINHGATADQLIAQAKTAQVEVIFYSNDLLGTLSARNLANFFTIGLGLNRSKQFQSDNAFGTLNVNPPVDADLHMGDLWERRTIAEFGINFIDCITDVNVPFFRKEGVQITLETGL